MIRTQAIEPEPPGLVRYLNAAPGGRTELARLAIVRAGNRTSRTPPPRSGGIDRGTERAAIRADVDLGGAILAPSTRAVPSSGDAWIPGASDVPVASRALPR